jgi:hypothetical protein
MESDADTTTLPPSSATQARPSKAPSPRTAAALGVTPVCTQGKAIRSGSGGPRHYREQSWYRWPGRAPGARSARSTVGFDTQSGRSVGFPHEAINWSHSRVFLYQSFPDL